MEKTDFEKVSELFTEFGIEIEKMDWGKNEDENYYRFDCSGSTMMFDKNGKFLKFEGGYDS